jgi:hypothetical protein
MPRGSTTPKGALLVREVPATVKVLRPPYVIPDRACHQTAKRVMSRLHLPEGK